MFNDVLAVVRSLQSEHMMPKLDSKNFSKCSFQNASRMPSLDLRVNLFSQMGPYEIELISKSYQAV